MGKTYTKKMVKFMKFIWEIFDCVELGIVERMMKDVHDLVGLSGENLQKQNKNSKNKNRLKN